MKQKNDSKGFTIVELLIVIVIISILAVLVIVAYSGVQQRANNSQTIQVTRSYAHAILSYAHDEGDYPRTVDSSTASNACLGIGYPGGKCANTSTTLAAGVGTATERTEFNTKISKYVNGKFPLPSLQVVTWNGQPFVGTAYWYAAGGTAPQIHYVLAGDVACPNIGGGATVKQLNSGTTRCVWTPPAL